MFNRTHEQSPRNAALSSAYLSFLSVSYSDDKPAERCKRKHTHTHTKKKKVEKHRAHNVKQARVHTDTHTHRQDRELYTGVRDGWWRFLRCGVNAERFRRMMKLIWSVFRTPDDGDSPKSSDRRALCMIRPCVPRLCPPAAPAFPAPPPLWPTPRRVLRYGGATLIRSHLFKVRKR